MEDQDQRRLHTSGNESRGVHVCRKCGWPFPKSHPSAKHRRAHKKICGTIEGYKLGQTGSDDEHASDDDFKTPGLVASGSIKLDPVNNEKGNDGIGEKIVRSEDDVFSDAAAEFSDSGLSPGMKERFQEESLDSGTDVERVHIKEQKISGPPEHSGCNAADVSPLIVQSSNDCRIEKPESVQSEIVEVGDETVELQGSLSGSTVDSLSSLVADSRTEELTVVHSDNSLGLPSDLQSSKDEAIPDVLSEKNIHVVENVTDCSSSCVAEETDLEGKDEIKSEEGMVEIINSSDKGVSEIAISDAVSLDHQAVDKAANLEEKNDAVLVSSLPQDDVPLELNSSVVTKEAEVESAHITQFATSSDVMMLQEKGEWNVNTDPLPVLDDRPNVTYLQSDYGNHEGVVSQNPSSLNLSESLEHKEDEFVGTVTEEDSFHFNTSQLSEKCHVLSSDTHVVDSSMKAEQVNGEPLTEDMRTEDRTEVQLTVESYLSSHGSGSPVNAIKTEMNENHMVHLSEENEPVGVQTNPQQISFTDGSLIASSNESQTAASVDEITFVINVDNVSHHEENKTEVNNVAVDGNDGVAGVESDSEIILNDLQTSNLLQSDVMQSSNIVKSAGAGEMSKVEQYDITDAQCKENSTDRDTSSFNSSGSHFEIPVTSDAVIDGHTRNSNGAECTDLDLLSGAQGVLEEDEINGKIKLNEECNRSVGTFANSHEAQDAELLVKAAEELARTYTSLTSSNTEPSVQLQHDTAVEDNSGGELSEDVALVAAVPVQDQSGNNLVKHSSSGFDASVYSSSRCDSMEGHWGSVSVFSMQSDPPAGIDTEILPSTGSLASTEAAVKSNSNIPKAAIERQKSGKSEMFEAPSFMTLVEPSHAVSPKGAAASEVQNLQPPDSMPQAAWFPSPTQVNNESQGRKKNEEIIAKVTSWSNSKEHTPLKSLLGEAAHSSNKPTSPKVEENSMTHKNGNNGSGLKTVNSILGPESPADQVAKGDAAKEWNSPARYPADIKREKSKIKSRPFWIQLVCCSSVDHQRT